MWSLLLLESFLLYSVVACVACTEQSLRLCRENEEYAECVDNCRTCAYRGNCMQTAECRPGCHCINGYFRNNQGNCVLEAFCEKTCGPNQDYSECGTSCPDTCDNYGIPRYCTQQCVKGCFCRKGLVRNNYGVCVIPERCGKTKCNADEEFQSCGTSCPDTCDNYGKPRPCTYECVAGCFCKPGLVRDRYFKCIEPKKCETGECKIDEQFYGNMPDCKNTCENYNNPGALCHVGKAGCFCKSGLVKRKDGKCVRPEHCDKRTEACGINEEIVRCAKPKWCNTCGIRGLCKLAKCESGCDCKRGYYRDRNGVCINEKFCSGEETCGQNQYYSECGTSCPDTCGNYGIPRYCTQQCVKGCFCRKGFVRNDFGECVIPEMCGKTKCNPDEVFQNCGTSCPDTCDNYGKPRSCTYQCVAGCFCKPGFVRDSNNFKCVEPNKCVKGNCGLNEEYTTCGSACPPTCNNVNNTDVYCPAVCTEGCFCKKGYIRNRERMCVPVERCPEYCGPNEEYRKCGSACPPTCDNINNTNVFCPAVCREGCFCKSGYIRNKEGICIPVALCPRAGKCGPNEEYTTCGSACPPTCDNINNTNVGCPAVCREGCFCKRGFIRNREQMCITVEMCPTPVCGENEMFSSCAIPCNDCRIKGKCNFLVCNKGCDCIKGYYRNENRICIPEYQCPISDY